MAYRRPTGITILAVLQFIGGILSLLGGLFFIVAGAGGQVPTDLSSTAVVPLVLGLGLIISGIISLIAGYGLFTLKGWGWWLALIFSVLNLLSGLINVLRGVGVGPTIFSLLISSLILYYLYTPTVRRSFGKR